MFGKSAEKTAQTLTPADLLDDFRDRLEKRVAVREAEQKAGREGASSTQTEGPQPSDQQEGQRQVHGLVGREVPAPQTCLPAGQELQSGRRESQTGGVLEFVGPGTPGSEPGRQSDFGSR